MKSRKHIARSINFDFGPNEPFALVPQTALDGERLTREQQQREADRKAAQQQQPELIEV